MFSKNFPHGAPPLCTTYWYISVKKLLKIVYLGLNPFINPLISKCEYFKILSKNFSHGALQLRT